MSQRHITSFFGGKDKRKADTLPSEACLSKNKKYDDEKRERRFIPSWTDQFPWVKYDEVANVMKCSICLKYPSVFPRNRKHTFVDGCSKFRIEYLKSHNTSDVHLECQSYERAARKSSNIKTDSESLSNTAEQIRPILKAFKTLDERTLKKMDNLFITAFHLAFRGKPLSDFESNLDLLDGVGVDIGSKYRNIPAAREFIKAIANSIRNKFIPELKQARYVTIMSDGSTDSAVIEQETVFLRYVSNGSPVSLHAATVPLEHCHADGVLDGIKTAVNTLGISFQDLTNAESEGPTLVSVNFDGASVMLGNKAGVAAKICAQAKHVIPVHCVAHKLELAVMDSVKHLNNISTFEETMKQIFKFYHYSPKMRRELRNVSDIFNTDLVHLSDIKQIRWVSSKIRAVRALKTSFHSILNHIESVATGKTEQSAKCTGWLKKMKTVTFVKTMCILLDILPIITEVSLVFQREDLLITEVPVELEGLALKLLNCKLDPVGTCDNMEYFSRVYNHEMSTFDGIKLSGACHPVSFKEDPFLLSLVDNIISYIDKRFACFSEKPLKSFSVFDFTQWPSQREILSVFGKPELTDLMEHFSPLFPEGERRQILQEFTDLKGHLKGCSRPVFESYQRLLSEKPQKFLNVCKLVELMFVISPGTAICERMFSSMNIVKTNHRTVLSQETLQHTMTIMTHGPQTLSQFNPRPALFEWIKNTPGSRHLLSMVKDGQFRESDKSLSSCQCASEASCSKNVD